MGLSNDLLSQFVKITKDDKKVQKESTVYGTVKQYADKLYVQIDGSELLTPASTTANMNIGERVVIQIKDHSATILGNMTSPSVGTIEFGAMNEDVDNIKANMIDANSIKVINAEINTLKTNKLDTVTANATYATIENLNSTNAQITSLQTNKLDTVTANATYATIENLNSTNAQIASLQTSKLDAESAKLIYANIDFSNIGMAAVEKLFTKSGIINNLVVGDTTITGELVGVTISGDLIKGNTIVADKLVIQGEDGIYYKLNTDGIKVEAEQTNYNSLNGSVITAKSITASKISVTDLVAFGATIGGFKLTENSIYSGVKNTIDNTTRGIYLDDEGQISFGDSNNFVRYYKDQNGVYKLEISAESVSMTSNTSTINLSNAINELNESTRANSNDLANYISTTNTEIENLQSQIDRINNYLVL